MQGYVRPLLPLLLVAAVVLSSGCISLDPQDLAMANPMIKDFLDEHPNAEIRITHFSALEAENILEEIRSDCGNPYIGAKEYYRVKITDPDTDFIAVVWVDWESKNIECAWKLGTGGKDTDKPKEDRGCEHHAKYICKGDHVYWFDSCGNREDKKEYCPDGCTDGSQECSGQEGCRSHHEYRCKGDHVYWFDSCGNREEKREYCELSCEGGRCIGKMTCEEMGGYCAYTACTAEARVCPDGTTVGRVPPYCDFSPCPATETESGDAGGGGSAETATTSDSATGMVTGYTTASSSASSSASSGNYSSTSSSSASGSGDGYASGSSSASSSGGGEKTSSSSSSSAGGGSGSYVSCKEGYVYGNYYCPNRGICCIPEKAECRSHYEYMCDGEHVYWFDSCGNREEKKEYCEHGCGDGACLEKEEFCGWSTYSECGNDSDCVSGGCSGQVCGAANDDMTTTCEYRECYNAESYMLSCGCHDGKCQWTAWDEKCWESDDGYDIYNKGCCETAGGSRLCDHCNNDGTLTEKYCEGSEIKWNATECPEGYGCEDGACTRCAKEGEYTSGAVSPEYYYGCCGGLESFDPHPEGWTGGGLLCYNPEKGTPVCDAEGTDDEGWYYPTGELLSETECSESLCTDSDGGHDYFTKGEVNPYCTAPCGVFIDTCSSNTTLIEHYCLEGEAMTEDYECPYGCEDGACLTESNQTS